MIGLDTNIILRYIVQDDVKQCEKAAQFLTRQCSKKNPGFINIIVLCETVWVLKKAYGFSRKDIATTIEQLLITEEISFQFPSLIFESLELYQTTKCDFSDILLSLVNKHFGCQTTYSFDKKAASLETIKLLID